MVPKSAAAQSNQRNPGFTSDPPLLPFHSASASFRPASFPRIPLASEQNFLDMANAIIFMDKDLATGELILENLKDPGDHPSNYSAVVFRIGDSEVEPSQWITKTASLSKRLSDLAGNEINESNYPLLVRACFEQRPEHLTPFSGGSLNTYNSLYFSKPESFFLIPSSFNSNPALSYGVAQLISRELENAGSNPKVKELCAGLTWAPKWRLVAEALGSAKKLDLIVTDFIEPEINRKEELGKIVNLRAERHNLLEAIETLEPQDKLDAVVAFYGFDSVWLPEDITLVKNPDSEWFECLYRVAIPDWHPNHAAIKNAFETNDASDVSLEDFRYLIVERTLRPFPVEDHPELEAALERRMAPEQIFLLAVPLGLVRQTKEFFQRQLKEDGVLIIGEAGINDPAFTQIQDVIDTGVAVKFKALDFCLCSDLLRSAGFEVEVHSAEDLVQNLPDDVDVTYIARVLEAPHTHVMVVRKGDFNP